MSSGARYFFFFRRKLKQLPAIAFLKIENKAFNFSHIGPTVCASRKAPCVAIAPPVVIGKINPLANQGHFDVFVFCFHVEKIMQINLPRKVFFSGKWFFSILRIQFAAFNNSIVSALIFQIIVSSFANKLSPCWRLIFRAQIFPAHAVEALQDVEIRIFGCFHENMLAIIWRSASYFRIISDSRIAPVISPPVGVLIMKR